MVRVVLLWHLPPKLPLEFAVALPRARCASTSPIEKVEEKLWERGEQYIYEECRRNIGKH